MNARTLNNGFDVKVIAAGLFAPVEKSGRYTHGILVTRDGAETHVVPTADLKADATPKQIERFYNVVAAMTPQNRAWLTMRIRREVHGSIAKDAVAVPSRKPAAKQAKPAPANVKQMPVPDERRIVLACKQGKMDKVYEIAARFPGRGMSYARADHGRRGATLQLAQELSGSRAEVMAFVEKLVSGKLAKGYRIVSTNFPTGEKAA